MTRRLLTLGGAAVAVTRSGVRRPGNQPRSAACGDSPFREFLTTKRPPRRVLCHLS